jgi:hypothetical protein
MLTFTTTKQNFKLIKYQRMKLKKKPTKKVIKTNN